MENLPLRFSAGRSSSLQRPLRLSAGAPLRVSPYLETPSNSSAAFSLNLENAGGIRGAGVVSASVAEPSAASQRRRESSTKTKQVKGMLPLRLFRRRPSAACQRRRIHRCEFPQFGMRRCLSAMSSVAFAQEAPPLRVSAGGFSVACQRRNLSSLRCVSAQEVSPLRVRRRR